MRACTSCGTFVRDGACPHCGRKVANPVVAMSAAAVLLGLGAQACGSFVGQPEYGVIVTDVAHETADTADTGNEE